MDLGDDDASAGCADSIALRVEMISLVLLRLAGACKKADPVNLASYC